MALSERGKGGGELAPRARSEEDTAATAAGWPAVPALSWRGKGGGEDTAATAMAPDIMGSLVDSGLSAPAAWGSSTFDSGWEKAEKSKPKAESSGLRKAVSSQRQAECSQQKGIVTC